MAFQEFLEKVGGMGRFQIIHVVLLSLPIFMMASHNLMQNFTAAIPKHRCRLNASWEKDNFTIEELRPFIPMDPSGETSSCFRYISPQFHFHNSTANSTDTELCADGWVYDHSEFLSTIITQWDLVCKHRRMRQVAQSIYMAGVLVGSIVFGSLSDKFGRRPLNIWSQLQMAVAGLCAAFAPNYIVYCIFRFLTGTALSGIVLNSYSLIVEWIPTRSRAFTSTATGYCYTLGQLVLVGLAYLIRDWHMLQLASSLPFFIYFLYSWWIPESGRWLVLTGKADQAVKELRKVAKLNGLKEEGETLTVEIIKSGMQREINAAKKSTYSVIDLVRTPLVRRISFCICCTWFSTSFAYYGLALDLQKFGVSIYLMQIIFGVVDIPAKFISYFVMSYIGRRVLQSGSMILAGIAILVNIFVPYEFQVVRTSMAVFGKGCLAASFNCLYLYTGEMYPTVIRQSGMGLGTMMARLGGIVAPLAQMTADYYQHLPLIIYGCSPIISGIAGCFLPETLGVPLPETIEEVERSSSRNTDATIGEKMTLKSQELTLKKQKLNLG
ncbi:solute carrier family 22 member 6-B-like [Spea bombifrons]|uniref:solute carrier family 22 member 6-B-like n=1 Tax=Spea bombifrons TaxID=233779 RepID=UPI00234A17DD|nr:solute carrier family 22 member 6-B-like [Spea bombifrons]